MARSAPQMVRLVQVLEELAVAGRSGRTLAELSRSLGVDKATCRPMLMELTEAGYLIRDPQRLTFHLGPRLVAIGRAAAHAVDVVDIARRPLLELVDRIGLCALAVTASGRELTVAEVIFPTLSTARTRRALGLRAGDRIPFFPPFGSVLVAWADRDEQQRWHRRGPQPDTAAQPLDEVLAVVRERGYAVEQYPPDPHELAELVAQSAAEFVGSRRAAALLDSTMALDPDALVGDIDPKGGYWPVSINAPVFDIDGRAVMAACLVDMPGVLSGAKVTALGEEVAATASAISRHFTARR